MRIATYNVEWFANLFDDHGRLLDDAEWSGRQDITRTDQIAALGHVFRAMDADAVMVIEAPDSIPSRGVDGAEALQVFAARFGLRTSRALIGYANHTQQEIALLYDPEVITPRHDPHEDPGAPRFDGRFRWDLDVDAAPETIAWSKPPLELDCVAGGTRFRMIGVHAKSKAPHGAKTPAEVMRLSIANRRKQLAQCIWLRRRVEQHLADGEPLVVLGDFNDGPGLDEYEKLFGRSGVEIVMGEQAEADMRLHDPHARQALAQKIAATPTTARFYLHDQRRFLSALLDYVMVSPELMPAARGWRIWHPFDDPDCWADPDLRRALLTASDHFPVSLDLNLGHLQTAPRDAISSK